MKIGFIGTGVMGSEMIKNLLDADMPVAVYNRTKSHADDVLKSGATWVSTPEFLAKYSDVIITMVGFPSDVKEVFYGKHGIFAGAHPDLLAIDMSTSSPKLARKIAKKSSELQMSALDAPVSGGDIGAKNGTLTIMVGGSKSDFNRALPIFKILGNTINFFGSAGQGQNAKMANQIMVAGTMTGMVETLVYAQKSQLDLTKIIEMIDGGAAQNWSMQNYGPRILRKNFRPGFKAKHFLKDLRIALDSADELGLDLPATKKARDLYMKMVEEFDLENDGTQGLIKIY